MPLARECHAYFTQIGSDALPYRTAGGANATVAGLPTSGVAHTVAEKLTGLAIVGAIFAML